MSDSNHSDEPSQLALDAIADAEPYPYWLESAEIPESNPTLVRDEHCDLCIVGGGYTGLWTAVIAKERDPSRDIVLIDKGEVGGAASGRNGGFMESSLTHGVGNGMDRHADEIDVLEELGVSNLDEIEAAIERYRMDCEYERNGVIDVAHTNHPPSYLDELREEHDLLHSIGQRVDVARPGCDARRGRLAHLHGRTVPFGSGGAGRSGEVGMGTQTRRRRTRGADLRAHEGHRRRPRRRRRGGAHPARHGALRQGRARHQRRQTPAQAHRPVHGSRVRLLLGDGAAEHRSSSSRIGWKHRQGLSDITNQFHYYRLTADNRILWGGYDAIYFWGSKVGNELESRPETWAKLSGHFFETFPQLDDVLFSHVWGGAIDTSTRFSVFFGQAISNRVAYAVGYTGLGVAATRFAAATMLDLLADRKTKATQTEFVRSKPLPFPPEPFRFAGIQATRWSMDREDKTGRRNAWLRTLDRLGLGFDS